MSCRNCPAGGSDGTGPVGHGSPTDHPRSAPVVMPLSGPQTYFVFRFTPWPVSVGVGARLMAPGLIVDLASNDPIFGIVLA